MSTATYNPDGGDKSNGQSSLLASNQPGGLSTWQGFTDLTSSDRTHLGTDDGNGVDIEQYFTFDGGPLFYAGGALCRISIADSGTTQFDVTAKVKEGTYGSEGFELYIWDANGSSFGSAMDSWSGGSPGATHSLTASITSSPDHYVDGSGYLWVLVVSTSYDSDTKLLTYVEVVNTFSAPSSEASDGDGGIDITETVSPSTSQAHASAGAGGISISEAAAGVGEQTQAADGAGGTVLTEGGAGQAVGPISATGAGGEIATATGEAGASQSHAADGDVGTLLTEGGAGQPAAAGADGAGGDVITATGAADGTQMHAAVGDGGASATVSGSASGGQAHASTGAEGAVLTGSGTARGYLQVRLSLSLPSANVRRITWEETGSVYLIIDGSLVGESDLGYLDLPSDQVVRGILIGYLEQFSPWPTPRDEVLLTVSGDAGALHHIERRVDAGAWSEIRQILGDTYTDGPLDDGAYDYRAYDEGAAAAESGYSTTRSATVSSMPDPPGAVSYSWDAGTKTLTLTTTASASADAATYRWRDGVDALELDGTPAQDSASLTYQRVMTTETGIYVANVRTVDADGNEEQNVSRSIGLAFDGGALVIVPAEPRLVEVYPAAGGKLTVEFLYDPRFEDPAPVWGSTAGEGAAAEARIYSDGGTGTMDLDTPVATVALGGPVAPARYTWTTGVLTDGVVYRFVVRIATGTGGAGLETRNTRAVSSEIAPDATAPSTPELQAELV